MILRTVSLFIGNFIKLIGMIWSMFVKQIILASLLLFFLFFFAKPVFNASINYIECSFLGCDYSTFLQTVLNDLINAVINMVIASGGI